MKLLLVAMSDSIHTARWISQIADQGWDIHLFPSLDYGITHPSIKNVTVHHLLYAKGSGGAKNYGIPVFSKKIAMLGALLDKYSPKYFPKYHSLKVRRLKRLIRKLMPDIIHSKEIQHAGYLTLEAKKLIGNKFPPWIVEDWGNDIYLFGRLKEHEPKIREVLASCDYYRCECERDLKLARELGFQGLVLPVFPNTGGFDLERMYKLRQPGPTHRRRLIMLKGYQHWQGRALVGLRALERCADVLKGYTVAIYLGFTQEVKIAAELFTHSTGIPVKIIPYVSHEEMLRYHGRARISICVNISDGVSTSFLEAMVMGSFPIQSWTACADEWVEDGKTAILVPPEDPDVIEKAIRRALTEDDLVNRAAELNWKTALERLDQSKLKPKAVEIYTTVAKEKGIGK